jgi:5'-nucleotidase
MKHAIWTAVAVGLSAVFVGGCSQEKKTQQNGVGVLEVGPASTVEPADRPTQVYPQQIDTPRPVQPKRATVKPLDQGNPEGLATPANGQSYTVKKGDTLFHIAKTYYGDGNKWQRIAEANPGVTPSSLKVGQVVMLPN